MAPSPNSKPDSTHRLDGPRVALVSQHHLKAQRAVDRPRKAATLLLSLQPLVHPPKPGGPRVHRAEAPLLDAVEAGKPL